MQLTLKQIDLKSGKKLYSKNQWSLLNTIKPLMIPGSDKTRGKSLTSDFKICGSQFLLDNLKFTQKKQLNVTTTNFKEWECWILMNIN